MREAPVIYLTIIKEQYGTRNGTGIGLIQGIHFNSYTYVFYEKLSKENASHLVLLKIYSYVQRKTFDNGWEKKGSKIIDCKYVL